MNSGYLIMFNIKEKLEIVRTLFGYCYNEKLECRVDYESSSNMISRAWNTANEFLENGNSEVLSKYNLKYINKIIKKLVSILGTDETKINLKHILYNGISISVINKMYLHDEDYEIKLWIDTYKKLLKLIKNNYE